MTKKETPYKAIRANKNTEGIERGAGEEKVQENEGKGGNKGCVDVLDNKSRQTLLIMESKTKTCYWCKKRKSTEQTYYITNKGKRQVRICVDCNLDKEIV